MPGKLQLQYLLTVCPNRFAPGGHDHAVFCRCRTGAHQVFFAFDLDYAELTRVITAMTQGRDMDTCVGGRSKESRAGFNLCNLVIDD